MKPIYRLPLALILITLSGLNLCSGFGCMDIPNEPFCLVKYGCHWTSSCVDYPMLTAIHSADANGASPVFVDSTFTGLADGSLAKPYNTLSQALLAGTSYIIIVNLPGRTAPITQVHSLSSGALLIEPLFATVAPFSLMFTISGTPTSLLSVSGKLTLRNATVQSSFTSSQVLFDVIGGNLELQTVDFDLCLSGYLIRIQKPYTSASVSWVGGTYNNSTSLFSLLGGSMTITDVIFTSVSLNNLLFSIAAHDLQIVRVFVTGCNITQFLTTNIGAKIKISDSYFSTSTLMLVSSPVLSTFELSNCTFEDLVLPKGSLLSFSQPSTTDGTFLIQDCNFFRCQTLTALVLAQLNGKNLYFNRNVIDSLSSSLNLTILSSPSDWLPAACIMTFKNTGLVASSNVFSNIPVTCVGVSSGTFNLSNSSFLNPQGTPPQKSSIGNTNAGWISMTGPGLGSSLSPSMVIIDCTFTRNFHLAQQGGALSFLGTSSLDVQVINCSFVSNSAINGGALYSENNLLVLTITSSLFDGNSAIDGGAIFMTRSALSLEQQKSIFCSLTTFINNLALRNGGAFFCRRTSMSLAQVSLMANNATNGGAVFLASTGSFPSRFDELNLERNIAINSGSVFHLLFPFEEVLCDSATYVALYGAGEQSVVARLPSSFLITFWKTNIFEHSSSVTASSQQIMTFNTSFKDKVVIQQKSGQSLAYLLTIDVCDSSGNILPEVNSELLQASIAGSTQSKNGAEATLVNSPISLSFESGRVTVRDQIRALSNNASQLSILFSRETTSWYNLLQEAGVDISFTLTLNFTECSEGEIFAESHSTCDACPIGSFSFQDPYTATSCNSCPSENSLCLGNALVLPKSGFWRFLSTGVDMQQCPRPESCLGGKVGLHTDEHGFCADEYTGPLCESCSSGNARSRLAGTCFSCEDPAHYVQLLAVIVLHLLLVATLVWFWERPQKLQGFLRVLLRFGWDALLLMQSSIPWPEITRSLLGVLTLPLTDGLSLLPLGCAWHVEFYSYNNLVLSSPLLYLVLCVLIHFVLFRKWAIGPVYGGLYLSLPPLTHAILENMHYRDYGQGSDSYLFAAPTVMCTSQTHSLRIMLLIFYLTIVALMGPMFLYIRHRHLRSKDKITNSWFSFMEKGLAARYFFWDYVAHLRYVALAFSLLVKPASFQAFLLTMIFMGSLASVLICKPFVLRWENRCEFIGNAVLVTVTITALYFQVKNTGPVLELFLPLLTTLGVCVILCLFGKQILKFLRIQKDIPPRSAPTEIKRDSDLGGTPTRISGPIRKGFSTDPTHSPSRSPPRDIYPFLQIPEIQEPSERIPDGDFLCDSQYRFAVNSGRGSPRNRQEDQDSEESFESAEVNETIEVKAVPDFSPGRRARPLSSPKSKKKSSTFFTS